MRREALESLTSIQVLVRELNQHDWTYQMQKNKKNQITHFFFAKTCFKSILQINFEILVMNVIYKTNRYKMFFFIISEQIVLHINFYVAFCFMISEISTDYIWILKQLKALYKEMKISLSTIIVIDMKKRLMMTIRNIFSSSIISHMLCIWHINKNVLANCRKSFDDQEAWTIFFALWKNVIYTSSKQDFWIEWSKIVDDYSAFHQECVDYLTFIYINHRRHFAKCYINRILHFDTTFTSRDEKEHVVLKRRLEFSTNDLKTVIDAINLLLINEYTTYLMKIDDDKIRLSMKLNKSIFQNLIAHIIISALRRIMNQYKLLTEQSTMMLACTNIFIDITELSCNHKIQKRLFAEEKLMIENVHSHWR